MLKGKTALVTGSTSGIGLGIAKALARQGANIVLNGFGDVDGAPGRGAGRRRRLRSAQVAYHGADMSRAADIEDMMKLQRHPVRPAWTFWSTTRASSMSPMWKIFRWRSWDCHDWPST